ncbi:MAG TPA: carbohydrate ABC transporter permease [Burkholderiales bacterium]|nr:carbohydrate ABC transporter permease [Burkholderiales bacterium]
MSALGAVRQVIAYLVLLVVTFLICFPLIWAASTSLKSPKDVMATPPTLLPAEVTIENYRNLVTGKQQYYRADQSYVPTTAAPQHFTSWFANSVIVSLGSTAISILISTLAAYSVTRFRYRGRRIIPYFSLLGYMIPSIILVFPLFLVMAELRLTNSLWSLTFGYVSITLPFCMWLLWAFFRGIPIELEEAAMIDGASRLRVFVDIVLPSAAPGIIAAAIFSLIVSWNDFLFARVFINSIENLPLTVGVMHFFEGTHVDWGLMMASAVLMTVPMAILFMLMQRHLVAGFGAGAVKG